MGSPPTTPLPVKRKMWSVCVAVLAVLLLFWVVFLVGWVGAKSDPCANISDMYLYLGLLILLTLPWLLWLEWLWRTPESRKPRISEIVLTWGLWGFILFVGLDAIPGLQRPHKVIDRASAVGSLRTINTAEITYASTYTVGYTSTLAQLGPAPGAPTPPATSTAAGLIDRVLASGKKSGYTFTYRPGALDAKRIISTYSVTARPSCKENASFFTDQSGVIRMTSEDRPATVDDRPLGE